MAKTINKRMTVKLEGDFVVFLIGMRVNKFWKPHKWLPVAMAMPKMLKESNQKTVMKQDSWAPNLVLARSYNTGGLLSTLKHMQKTETGCIILRGKILI